MGTHFGVLEFKISILQQKLVIICATRAGEIYFTYLYSMKID